MNDIILSTQNGEPVASSRDVAKRFGKEHRNVMRDIETAITQIAESGETAGEMFQRGEYEIMAGFGKVKKQTCTASRPLLAPSHWVCAGWAAAMKKRCSKLNC